MDIYKSLNKQVVTDGEYSIVPIRYHDRLEIMKWRNEQLFHLRQNKPLTEKQQNNYFDTVVAKLFNQEQPDQILFSYLEGDNCIGYGGLVHMNWTDKNAEISFIMDTKLEENYFEFHWKSFLALIEKVAFNDLNFHKIYVFAFDLRPYLYEVLVKCNYYREAVLKEHCYIDGCFKDVVIYSKLKS